MKTFEFVYKVVASGENVAEAESEAVTALLESAQKRLLGHKHHGLKAVESNLIEDTDGRLIKVCVGCESTNGPDLFFVKVECTDEQYENGVHYMIALDWVRENHEVDGPYWVCDENDPAKAVMDLFNWDTASVAGDGTSDDPGNNV